MATAFPWSFWKPFTFFSARSKENESETSILPIHSKSNQQQPVNCCQNPTRSHSSARVHRQDLNADDITPSTVGGHGSFEIHYPSTSPTPRRGNKGSRMSDPDQSFYPSLLNPQNSIFPDPLTAVTQLSITSSAVAYNGSLLVSGSTHGRLMVVLTSSSSRSCQGPPMDLNALTKKSSNALNLIFMPPHTPSICVTMVPAPSCIDNASIPLEPSHQKKVDVSTNPSYSSCGRKSSMLRHQLLTTGTFENGQKLKEYQLLDLNRLVTREAGEKVCGTDVLNCIGLLLAYDMGLGKTIVSIALIVCNPPSNDYGGARATLIVVPNKGIMDHWQSELIKFAPFLDICFYNSSSVHLRPEADIVLLTYAQLQRQHSSFKLNPTSKAAAPIFHYSWYRQINDEAHKFRNPSTTTAKAVWAVSKQHGHCLTGTPAQNSLLDFHPLFKFLGVTHENVDVLNIYEQKIYSKRQQGPIINKSAKKLFDLIKKDFCIFRSKSDVDSETGRPLVMLPSCTDLIIDIALSVEERIIYSHIKEMSLHIFATLTRLRQACDHPSLVQRVLQDGAGSDQSEENISLRTMVKSQGSLATMSRKLPRAARNPFSDFFRSSKLKAMLQILHKCKGQKTIIFTHFTSFIPVIAQVLHSANIRWTEYTGGTSHKDQEEALMQIAEDEECSVIIISILAGSVGLNITSCNNIILMEPWWNPYAEDQAIARVHRIGQMLPITVYRLVVQESIEESILKTQQLKREMIGDMYGDVAGDPCGDLDEATRRA